MLAALRSLRRSPAFVAIAVLSLGLAIGLNTTMLSVIDAVLHPYVPYAQPERLFALSSYGMTRRKVWVNRPMYLGVRARTDLYANLVPYTAVLGVAEANGHLATTEAATVGTRLFEALGVKPIVGRVFGTAGDVPADAQAAVIGYQLWKTAFDGDPNLARLHLSFNGRTYGVIGVMPPTMAYPRGAAIWLAMPRAMEGSADGPGPSGVLLELKPGDTRSRVKSQLVALAQQFAIRYDGNPAMFDYRLYPLQPRPQRPAEGVVATALVSTFVLVVACLNLANLMLVRGLARRRELAVRLALGASRGGIMRHVFSEAVILAVLGGLWGVLLSVWGVKLAEAHMPAMLRQLGFVAPHVRWRVVGVGILVTAATVFAAGILPAIHAARANVSEAMKDGGGTSTGRRGRLYRFVTVGEIALALVVMIVASFAMDAFYREARFKFSYDASHMLDGYVSPRRPCDSLSGGNRFWSDMAGRVAAVPGVRYAAAETRQSPVNHEVTSDQPGAPIEIVLGRGMTLGFVATTPDYFRVYGFPILAGRDFEPGDVAGEGSAIVNRTLAAKLWPLTSPVGRLIKLGSASSNAPWVRVVGVVGPTKAGGDSTVDDTPLLTVARQFECGSALMIVRTGGPPASVAGAVYHTVRSAIPKGGMVNQFRSPRASYDASLQTARLDTAMFLAFGAFAVLLSAVGIYGVLSYAVGRRIREFAMYTALGARAPDIARVVMREAAEMVLGGTALGATAALVVGLSVFANARGVEGAVVLAAAEAVVIAATLAACVGPIRRAVRADPVDLLRST